MQKQTIEVTIGCLLHDIGKIIYRANLEAGDHSELGYKFLAEFDEYKDKTGILNSIRFHHAKALKDSNVSNEDICSICYIADNISAAADRRQVTDAGNFEKYLPLSPIFTHLNGEHTGYSLRATTDGNLCMPIEDTKGTLTAGIYNQIVSDLKTQLKGLPPSEEWVNSMLSVMEGYTSSIPSSTNTKESADVSLYDHSKICAAVGACISEYLLDKGIMDLRKTLVDNEQKFKDEKAFLLYSADYSGIQKFIYTVSTKNALRSLRSRSFFLELSMDHYIDELLSACGVSRANLLYSGGGHCYILLPNTQGAIDSIKEWNKKFNDWLLSEFGCNLYLASGCVECSPNDLTNIPAKESPYKNLFRKVSYEISKNKNCRYTAEQIRKLNSGKESENGRECAICGRADKLKTDEDWRDICQWCSLFEELSTKIQQKDVFVVMNGENKNAEFSLPGMKDICSFVFTDVDEARNMLEQGKDICRIYTKNKYFAGLNYSGKIYVGDYSSNNQIQELAKLSSGVPRLGVCRMDVDNLGQSFVSGFEKGKAENIEEKYTFVTISRTAAFSRQMSLFFKGYINSILDGSFENKKPLNVAIVYSGGDDVFLVGAWTDTIEAANRIQNCFNRYCLGALTISGGVAMVDSHYPIRLGANYVAQLEEISKSQDGKNRITLLEANDLHSYRWNEYISKVAGEKLTLIKEFFEEYGNEKGNAFLYKIVNLLRESSKNRISLARYAYLLARLEPKENNSKDAYSKFSKSMYEWGLTPENRKQLITAIYIYVYSTRERS